MTKRLPSQIILTVQERQIVVQELSDRITALDLDASRLINEPKTKANDALLANNVKLTHELEAERAAHLDAIKRTDA